MSKAEMAWTVALRFRPFPALCFDVKLIEEECETALIADDIQIVIQPFSSPTVSPETHGVSARLLFLDVLLLYSII